MMAYNQKGDIQMITAWHNKKSGATQGNYTEESASKQTIQW